MKYTAVINTNNKVMAGSKESLSHYASRP